MKLRASALLAVVLFCACDDSASCTKDEPACGPVKVEAVGVQVELPAGWSYGEKNGGHWVSRSMTYGAKLETVDTMPGSLEDAKKTIFLQGEARDEGSKDKTFYAVIDGDFGNMVLPYVYVVTPVGDGGVMCSGQLQAEDDPKALLDVCLSMKPL